MQLIGIVHIFIAEQPIDAAFATTTITASSSGPTAAPTTDVTSSTPTTSAPTVVDTSASPAAAVYPITEDVPVTTVSTTTTPAYIDSGHTNTAPGPRPPVAPALLSVEPLPRGRALNWPAIGGHNQSFASSGGGVMNFVTTIAPVASGGGHSMMMDLSDVSMDDDEDEHSGDVVVATAATTTEAAAPRASKMDESSESRMGAASATAVANNTSDCTDNGSTYQVSVGGVM